MEEDSHPMPNGAGNGRWAPDDHFNYDAPETSPGPGRYGSICSILHRFQTHSDYQIKGYDGQKTKATGQGYAQIYDPATQQADEMLFVYTLTVSGTIILL